MAPNPIISIRERPTCNERPDRSFQPQNNSSSTVYGLGLIGLIVVAATRPGARIWIYSGTCIESLILVHGALKGTRILPTLHLQTQLLLLNLAFLLSSTSWLFSLAFSIACYMAVVCTCLVQYGSASGFARTTMRKLLPSLQFFEDKIAFFDLPALAIDAEITGLFVVRGITMSLLNLTLEAHGIELVIRLNSKTELCIYLDLLKVKFFESIELSDVYGNLKIGEDEGLFVHEGSNTSDGQHNSPKKRELVMDTNSFLLNAGANTTGRASKNDARSTTVKSKAEPQSSTDGASAKGQYEESLGRIEATSPISIARKELEKGTSSLHDRKEREVRQTICAKLREFPSISHVPDHALSVHVLQTIFPRIRRFLHRLPLLLRLLLSPLSYFHPIHMSSINIAGPGEELQRVIQDYLPQSKDSSGEKDQEAQEELSTWLSDADFCVEIADITSLAQVPFGPTGLITIYLRGSDVGLYRTVVKEQSARLVTHIGGADATFVIPAFLLPHHEHYLPPKPKNLQRRNLASANSNSQETSFKLQGQAKSDEVSDATEVIISMHASLPTYFDQSLLDIAAALAKATELVDLENLFERESSGEQAHEGSSEPDSASQNQTPDNDGHETSGNDDGSTSTVSRTRQYLKSGLKKGLRMDKVGDKLNDRWVARTVGKIAARLEEAEGDFGYTVRRQVPLQPYRSAAESASKILP